MRHLSIADLIMPQVTSNVLMIRPLAFGFNAETAQNNVFQQKPDVEISEEISLKARDEFDRFVKVLHNEGIQVTVIEDTPHPLKPDAIFPNNWISFHEGGVVITYPMYSHLRRNERREDIIEKLSCNFIVKDRIHLEPFEAEHTYLEGTGSMVLDRVHKVAYACISERTDPSLLTEWCERVGFTQHTFHAVSDGQPIYHTNVMMAIASRVAIVCLECLPDNRERELLKEELGKHREVVEITQSQVRSYAGNMLALVNRQGEELMVMSTRALDSLSPDQKRRIEKYCRMIASPIPTIENVGGGSARCMIAEIFLDPK